MRLYRVLYYNQSAAPHEQGGVFYIPPQGAGRIDNPASYDVLYAGDTAEGVCAEIFYRGKYRQEWSSAMLRPLPSGDRRVLAWYDMPDVSSICDLDDPNEIQRRRLRPSRIITRDYTITQAWALRIYERNAFVGIKWWSYCDGRWGTLGLWDRTTITVGDIEELSVSHAAIVGAARAMNVRIR